MPDHSCSSILTECVDLCFIWETVYGSQSKVSEHADNLTFTVDADDRRLDLSIRSKPWQKITTSWNIPFWGEEEGSLCDVRHRTIAHLYWLNSMWVCLAKLRKKPTVHMKSESSSTSSWLRSNTFWKCTAPQKTFALSRHRIRVWREQGQERCTVSSSTQKGKQVKTRKSVKRRTIQGACKCSDYCLSVCSKNRVLLLLLLLLFWHLKQKLA